LFGGGGKEGERKSRGGTLKAVRCREVVPGGDMVGGKLRVRRRGERRGEERREAKEGRVRRRRKEEE